MDFGHLLLYLTYTLSLSLSPSFLNVINTQNNLVKICASDFSKKDFVFCSNGPFTFFFCKITWSGWLSVCKNKISHIFSWAGLQTTYFTTNMNSPNDVQDSNANSNQKTYSIRRALKKTIVQLYSSNKLSCKKNSPIQRPKALQQNKKLYSLAHTQLSLKYKKIHDCIKENSFYHLT